MTYPAGGTWSASNFVCRGGQIHLACTDFIVLANRGPLPGLAGLAVVGRRAFQDQPQVSFGKSKPLWRCNRADQNRFIDCTVRFQANRLKNFIPSEWHREQQIAYVKADLLNMASRVPGSVAI